LYKINFKVMDEIIDNRDTRSNFLGERPLPNANAILVLGIISIVTCWLYAIPGLVCGIIALVLFNKDKKVYQADPLSYANFFKNAKAGQVCAIIGVCLSALMFIYLIVVIAFIGTVFSSLGHL
jgi:hypothetical protein